MSNKSPRLLKIVDTSSALGYYAFSQKTNMSEVGLGISKNKDPVEAITEASYQAKLQINDIEADIAILFSHDFLRKDLLLEALARSIESENLIGTSTDTLFSSEADADITLSVLLIKKSDIRFALANAKINEGSLYASGQKLASNLTGKITFKKQCLILFCPNTLKENLQDFIKGAQSVLGKSFPIFGFAAAKTNHRPNYIYFQRDFSTQSIAALLLGGNTKTGFNTAHGWKPIGKPHLLNRAASNSISGIDNATPLNLYKTYLGEDVFSWREERLRKTSLLYPLGIPMKQEKEYLIRSNMQIAPDHSLIFNGEIPPESEANLMINTKESCLAAAENACFRALSSLQNETPKFALCFSSIARYNLLGRDRTQEIDIMKRILGSKMPFIGCYSDFEIAPFQSPALLGESYIHNNCISILTVGN